MPACRQVTVTVRVAQDQAQADSDCQCRLSKFVPASAVGRHLQRRDRRPSTACRNRNRRGVPTRKLRGVPGPCLRVGRAAGSLRVGSRDRDRGRARGVAGR